MKKCGSRVVSDDALGTEIGFLGRLERFVIIVPEVILRGSQARKSAFWAD